MPHVEITWVEGRSPEQKRKIAERVTAVLIAVGTAKRKNIQVTYPDLHKNNYAESRVMVGDQQLANSVIGVKGAERNPHPQNDRHQSDQLSVHTLLLLL